MKAPGLHYTVSPSEAVEMSLISHGYCDLTSATLYRQSQDKCSPKTMNSRLASAWPATFAVLDMKQDHGMDQCFIAEVPKLSGPVKQDNSYEFALYVK